MATTSEDGRPPVAIGHIGPHVVDDLAAATRFYVTLGCRLIAEMETLAVLELRGGTHLVLRAGDAGGGGNAAFDIMVDDLDAARSRFQQEQLDPSRIERGKIHDHFRVTDPSGWVVTVTSSHAVGPV